MKLRMRVQLAVGKAYIHTMSAIEEVLNGTSLNPFSRRVWENPYYYHSRMRQKAPIYYSKTWRAYWVTRFDWAQEILKDKRFGANVRQFEDRTINITRNMDERRLERFNNPSMLDLDPPDHTRIRKLASQGFVHKFIQSLEPRIREIVHECLDPNGNAQTIDFVESLAKPLPAIVIAEMLGLPKEDHEQFASWSEDLMLGTSTNDADKLEKSLNANTELIDYFRRMAEIKRAKPGDDMLSRLIAAEEEGDSLSEAELYNNCVLLLVAGHETTTRLISNGLYLLLKNPDQLQQLRDDPSRIPQAIEEMLRFEPPVQATRRFALEDVEFNGARFKRGDLVFLSIAGSNRDPLANESPDVFDISRDQPRLVSFGYGIHLCIGASLARLEAKVAFEEILNRYDTLSLEQAEPMWGENAFFRGHEALNVRVSE